MVLINYDDNEKKKNKILIFAANGYLGKFIVKASLSMGHPTYVYVRPSKPNDSSKLQVLKDLQSLGVTIFQGELDDHKKLVSALKEVDIVISTLAVPQHLEQLKIIRAIKQANNIKRFIPSEFGNEVDRVSGLPPFEAILENKRKIRRAIEEANIPYTFVSANSFASYFVDYLLHPNDKTTLPHITLYGTGQAKVVLNYEKDVAAYTLKVATDPRAENRVIIYRPEGNIITQLELLSLWEKKTDQTFKRVHVPEEEIIKLTETLPFPDNVPPAVLHNIFIKGDQMSYEISKNDLEASKLYPEYKYTSIDAYLDLCLVNAPKPKLATFG
ncbi:isoeugenol synthase 1 [Arachis duranensis]|uniref:Isoeugenol synthase 1 n=1 Tax=Arachis duranensis TaxID=130453 RepID=A0A6P5MK03_ARADU|nr:isoeugenol synthase 1 [Arachis duranensis]